MRKITMRMTFDEVVSAFQYALEEVQELAFNEAPRGETGNLQSSIKASEVEVSKNNEIKGSVFIDPSNYRSTQDNYGIYQHQGTGIYGDKKRPYVIKARKAKALAFTSGGEQFFRKSVTIQGIKPNPFFERARTSFERDNLEDMKKLVFAGVMKGLKIKIRE